ncbi:hypothetical protein [Defluviimonas sp. D31]|uniref:hypothetical protein n=1 Tax=Defluviimonas sp. D31 TaxID=3083253 RepID=UPI0039905657
MHFEHPVSESEIMVSNGVAAELGGREVSNCKPMRIDVLNDEANACAPPPEAPVQIKSRAQCARGSADLVGQQGDLARAA